VEGRGDGRELDLELAARQLDLPRADLDAEALRAGAEDLAEEREDERLLPGAGGAVEERVRDVTRGDELPQVARCLGVELKVVERPRAMLRWLRAGGGSSASAARGGWRRRGRAARGAGRTLST
jgi:hypothetical protein